MSITTYLRDLPEDTCADRMAGQAPGWEHLAMIAFAIVPTIGVLARLAGLV